MPWVASEEMMALAAQEEPPLQEEGLCLGRTAAATLPPCLELSSFPLNTNAYFERKYLTVCNVSPSPNTSSFCKSKYGFNIPPKQRSSDLVLFIMFSSQFCKQRKNSHRGHALLSHDAWKQEVSCTHGLTFLFI